MPLILRSLRQALIPRSLYQQCRKKYTSSATAKSTKSSLQKLPDGPARTRFAPSPTGYLHLGSLRTALFNYLLAKATGGQFLLRIEDTDQKRTIADAEDRLCQDLQWAGLQWDEGPKVGGPYGPYKQSERTALYREHAEKLLQSGNAYRCFCTAERLESLARMRTELGVPANYDRACAHVSLEEAEDRAANGELHVIRLKVPQKYPEFKDIVYGRVRDRGNGPAKAQLHPAFQDPILLKSDGFPTYHLANVVDDHLMKITHVVRGAEWMSSTPNHLAMYEAFGWQPPAFAHVGLLVDKTRQKLSKRNMDLDVSSYRDTGIFPETLTNFVALLGWSHNQKNDVMSLQDLVDNFSMKFTRGDTVVSFEKMPFLQRAHAERYSAQTQKGDTSKLSLMLDPLKTAFQEDPPQDSIAFNAILAGRSTEDYLKKIIHEDARSYVDAPAFIKRNSYFFNPPMASDLIAGSGSVLNTLLEHGKLCSPEHDMITLEEVAGALKMLEFIPEEGWNFETVQTCTRSIIKTKHAEDIENNVAEITGTELDLALILGKLEASWGRIIHRYLRWVLTAGNPGPDGASVIVILGRDETMRRLSLAEELLARGEIREVNHTPTQAD